MSEAVPRPARRVSSNNPSAPAAKRLSPHDRALALRREQQLSNARESRSGSSEYEYVVIEEEVEEDDDDDKEPDVVQASPPPRNPPARGGIVAHVDSSSSTDSSDTSYLYEEEEDEETEFTPSEQPAFLQMIGASPLSQSLEPAKAAAAPKMKPYSPRTGVSTDPRWSLTNGDTHANVSMESLQRSGSNLTGWTGAHFLTPRSSGEQHHLDQFDRLQRGLSPGGQDVVRGHTPQRKTTSGLKRPPPGHGKGAVIPLTNELLNPLRRKTEKRGGSAGVRRTGTHAKGSSPKRKLVLQTPAAEEATNTTGARATDATTSPANAAPNNNKDGTANAEAPAPAPAPAPVPAPTATGTPAAGGFKPPNRALMRTSPGLSPEAQLKNAKTTAQPTQTGTTATTTTTAPPHVARKPVPGPASVGQNQQANAGASPRQTSVAVAKPPPKMATPPTGPSPVSSARTAAAAAAASKTATAANNTTSAGATASPKPEETPSGAPKKLPTSPFNPSTNVAEAVVPAQRNTVPAPTLLAGTLTQGAGSSTPSNPIPGASSATLPPGAATESDPSASSLGNTPTKASQNPSQTTRRTGDASETPDSGGDALAGDAGLAPRRRRASVHRTTQVRMVAVDMITPAMQADAATAAQMTSPPPAAAIAPTTAKPARPTSTEKRVGGATTATTTTTTTAVVKVPAKPLTQAQPQGDAAAAAKPAPRPPTATVAASESAPTAPSAALVKKKPVPMATTSSGQPPPKQPPTTHHPLPVTATTKAPLTSSGPGRETTTATSTNGSPTLRALTRTATGTSSQVASPGVPPLRQSGNTVSTDSTTASANRTPRATETANGPITSAGPQPLPLPPARAQTQSSPQNAAVPVVASRSPALKPVTASASADAAKPSATEGADSPGIARATRRRTSGGHHGSGGGRASLMTSQVLFDVPADTTTHDRSAHDSGDEEKDGSGPSGSASARGSERPHRYKRNKRKAQQLRMTEIPTLAAPPTSLQPDSGVEKTANNNNNNNHNSTVASHKRASADVAPAASNADYARVGDKAAATAASPALQGATIQTASDGHTHPRSATEGTAAAPSASTGAGGGESGVPASASRQQQQQQQQPQSFTSRFTPTERTQSAPFRQAVLFFNKGIEAQIKAMEQRQQQQEREEELRAMAPARRTTVPAASASNGGSRPRPQSTLPHSKPTQRSPQTQSVRDPDMTGLPPPPRLNGVGGLGGKQGLNEDPSPRPSARTATQPTQRAASYNDDKRLGSTKSATRASLPATATQGAQSSSSGNGGSGGAADNLTRAPPIRGADVPRQTSSSLAAPPPQRHARRSLPAEPDSTTLPPVQRRSTTRPVSTHAGGDSTAQLCGNPSDGQRHKRRVNIQNDNSDVILMEDVSDLDDNGLNSSPNRSPRQRTLSNGRRRSSRVA